MNEQMLSEALVGLKNVIADTEEEEVDDWAEYYSDDDEEDSVSFQICEDCGHVFKGTPQQKHYFFQNHRCDAKDKLKLKVDKINNTYRWL